MGVHPKLYDLKHRNDSHNKPNLHSYSKCINQLSKIY